MTPPTDAKITEKHSDWAESLLNPLGLSNLDWPVKNGIFRAVEQALANAERDGRQAERERVAKLCAEQACHFRNLANRADDHHISDEFLGIAKGFSKASSLALEEKDNATARNN